jgi:uncharacterized protein YbaR (Trm112 family)
VRAVSLIHIHRFRPLFMANHLEMFNCPYCKQQTNAPMAARFAAIDVMRANCENCDKEFVIVESLPVTEEQYQANKPL